MIVPVQFIVLSENIIITPGYYPEIWDQGNSIFMVDYYIGTMGFSYKEWVGALYPKGLAARDYLSFYSRIFNAVEIDSTFYGIPRREAVNRWKESTPKGFKVCVKVPREITHEAGLVNVDKEMLRFIDTVQILDDKLGVILLQFPPSFASSNANHLSAFLEHLNMDLRFAVEFRHRSWYTSPTAELLAKNKICWVATEFEGMPKEVGITSDILFIRLVGKHGRFHSHNREQIEVSPQLEWWWQWIRSQAEMVQSVYVFINDDFSGYAPASVNKLKGIIGLPTVEPDLPKQMKLF